MFDLSKAEAQLLEIAEKQFQNTLNEAAFLRAVRLASILESHGVHGDTPGRFVKSGPNAFSWLPNEDQPEAEAVVGNIEPAAEPEE